MKKLLGRMLIVALLLIAATAVAGDERDSVVTIELNTPYESQLTETNKEQYYRFSLSSAGVIDLAFSHDYDSDSAYLWEATITNEVGDKLLVTHYEGDRTDEETSCHVGLPAGDYTLVIRKSHHFSENRFRFAVNFNQSDYWEAEMNERKDTATAIQLNTEYSGNARNSDDVDYYRFTLPSAGFIGIDFSHDYANDAGHSWTMKVLNSKGDLLDEQHYMGDDTTTKTSSKVGLPADTYYIAINSQIHEVDYKLKVNYFQTEFSEKEFNDNIPAANPIYLNTVYLGTIRHKGDVDYYSFTLSAPGIVSIRFFHEYVDTPMATWYLDLLNEKKDSYCRQEYSGDALKAVESGHIGLPAGNYYICIMPGIIEASENYSFSVLYEENDNWEKEFNNDKHSANKIELDYNISGALGSSMDKDYFKVDLPAEGYLSIIFQHTFVNKASNLWELDVLTEEGEKHETFHFTGDSEDKQIVFTSAMQPGSCYIQIVRADDYSAVDYSLCPSFSETLPIASEQEKTSIAEPESWICQKCGYENDAAFCIKCGTKKPEAMVCPGCGAVYEAGSEVIFCGACGTKIQMADTETSSNDSESSVVDIDARAEMNTSQSTGTEKETDSLESLTAERDELIKQIYGLTADNESMANEIENLQEMLRETTLHMRSLGAPDEEGYYLLTANNYVALLQNPDPYFQKPMKFTGTVLDTDYYGHVAISINSDDTCILYIAPDIRPEALSLSIGDVVTVKCTFVGMEDGRTQLGNIIISPGFLDSEISK